MAFVSRSLSASALLFALLVASERPSAAEAPAQGVPSATASASRPGSTPLPLPALPKPTSTALPAPDPQVSAELDAWLGQLTSANPAERETAVKAIDQVTPAMVPAVAKKLAALKKSASTVAMATALSAARKRRSGASAATAGSGTDAGVAAASNSQSQGDEDEDDESEPARPGAGSAEAQKAKALRFDWFVRVMGSPHPTDEPWRDLASVLGMSRMLERVGTTPAVRGIIGIYAGFPDVLRVDVQRQIERLADHAVPALIDARHGDAKPLRAWASRQLDVIGRTVPGEAVQTTDNQVLAEVLRAYGRAKDMDALRVVVSFANSDRTNVREAAREAVGVYAENALWQLREAYENLIGKKPSEDWGWERVARELFAAYDRARLSEVYALMDTGLLAERAGKLEDMVQAFDRVLARAPLFERRAEMVRGYYELACSVEKTDPTRALSLLHRAARIDPSGAEANTVGAELSFLQAEDLASRGVVDQAAYKHAIELDPNHERARAALDKINRAAEEETGAVRRYAAASVIALIALLGVVVLFWRKRAAGT